MSRVCSRCKRGDDPVLGPVNRLIDGVPGFFHDQCHRDAMVSRIEHLENAVTGPTAGLILDRGRSMTNRERRVLSWILDMADFWGVTEYRPNNGRLPFDKFLDLSPYPVPTSDLPRNTLLVPRLVPNPASPGDHPSYLGED